jgi:hypothetical protein
MQFGGQFRNVVFVSVGEVDSSLLKGSEEVTQLEQQVADDLLEYCRLAEHLGFHAQTRTGLGAEVVTELRRLCLGCPRVSPARLFLRANWCSLMRSMVFSAVSYITTQLWSCCPGSSYVVSAW